MSVIVVVTIFAPFVLTASSKGYLACYQNLPFFFVPFLFCFHLFYIHISDKQLGDSSTFVFVWQDKGSL